YFWDFGDGTNTTGLVANYAFSSNGTFIVTLTVTDDDGDTGTINATKTILNPPPSMFLKTSREIVPSSEGMLQSIGYAHFNLVGYHHSRMELESY
ncbi:PKD domain-containing protein, partial [Candidatus Bathyarchaeota archaeon]|nr:PKD domain-containing protein [Candidatus Bathyarchaeota archaeon]